VHEFCVVVAKVRALWLVANPAGKDARRVKADSSPVAREKTTDFRIGVYPEEFGASARLQQVGIGSAALRAASDFGGLFPLAADCFENSTSSKAAQSAARQNCVDPTPTEAMA